MSDQASAFKRKVHVLLETLDENDDVKTCKDSSAVITFEDGSTHRLSGLDCQKLFQSQATVKQFCHAVKEGREEISIELYDVTLPEEALFELDDSFLVDEV